MLMGIEAFDIELYGDITGDGIVDFEDLPGFFELWLEDDCEETAELDLDGNCVINFHEFSVLAQNWLEEAQ